ncbi:MAG: hypothetical protein H7A32_00490 [Deltaproteobacteria bacterium]|nr:hypothetical protein [Deltaproteobacteria bacterium]
MKKSIFKNMILLLTFLATTSMTSHAFANGNTEAELDEILPPPPVCSSQSPDPKIKIMTWEPRQKLAKFLGSITECQSDQLDVLELLGGPNVIGYDYRTGKEKWSYTQMWNYKLQNPKEESIVLMSKPGKRIKKAKKRMVEVNLVFNENDIIESMEVLLIRYNND